MTFQDRTFTRKDWEVDILRGLPLGEFHLPINEDPERQPLHPGDLE